MYQKDIQDRIDAYLLGRMSDSERAAFEGLMDLSPALKAQFMFTRDVQQAIRSREEKRRKFLRLNMRYELERQRESDNDRRQLFCGAMAPERAMKYDRFAAEEELASCAEPTSVEEEIAAFVEPAASCAKVPPEEEAMVSGAHADDDDGSEYVPRRKPWKWVVGIAAMLCVIFVGYTVLFSVNMSPPTRDDYDMPAMPREIEVVECDDYIPADSACVDLDTIAIAEPNY